MTPTRLILFLFAIMLSSISAAQSGNTPEVDRRTSPQPATVGDLLWIWGNPKMGTPGPHTLATYVDAGPAERAQLIGISNVTLCGMGLPQDKDEALKQTAEVATAPRLVWEIGCDDEDGGPPFEYEETVSRVQAVREQYPQLEAVLLDDMTSLKIARGFRPEHIRGLRTQLRKQCPGMKVWGVVYSMNFDIPNIDEYIAELDVINLWIWHAKDTGDIQRYVEYLEARFPGKPIVLGLYLYDYGEGRRMPADLLEAQCATALELAHSRRIEGIVLLTINNDADAVSWAANWVSTVHGQRLGTSTSKSSAAQRNLRGSLPASFPKRSLSEGSDHTILMALNTKSR